MTNLTIARIAALNATIAIHNCKGSETEIAAINSIIHLMSRS